MGYQALLASYCLYISFKGSAKCDSGPVYPRVCALVCVILEASVSCTLHLFIVKIVRLSSTILKLNLHWYLG